VAVLDAFYHSLGWLWLVLGAGFFLAGTVALIRFPDVYSRLHALTKADNLGLGLICLGMAWELGWGRQSLKFLLIWLLALLAGSVSCHLVARFALRSGLGPDDPP